MNRESINPVHPGFYTGCMAEMNVLLSFVGNRDPYPETEEEYGPLLSLLQGLRIIGQDPGFLEVLEQAHKVVRYDVSVLIRGETGTGKELIARFGSPSGIRRRSSNETRTLL